MSGRWHVAVPFPYCVAHMLSPSLQCSPSLGEDKKTPNLLKQFLDDHKTFNLVIKRITDLFNTLLYMDNT